MKLLLLFISLIVSASTVADSIFVYPVIAHRVDKELGATMSDLIKGSITEEGRQVTDNKLSAKYSIKAVISRLGKSYTVSLRLLKGRKTRYSAKLKSNGEEELDTVVSRLVRSALRGKRTGTNKRIGQITDEEVTEVSRRTESRHYTYFALGPFTLSHLDTPGIGYYLAYGHLWEVSANAAIKIITEGSFQSNENTASIASISGGANYYFSGDDTSFFVGGDLGYGVAATTAGSGDSTGGFSLGTSLGVIFFRTSGTQMSLTARFLSILSDNSFGNPNHAGLALGFHY